MRTSDLAGAQSDEGLLREFGVHVEEVVRAGGLAVLRSASVHELQHLLGRARGRRLFAALELGRRCLIARDSRPQLKTPDEIGNYLMPALSHLRHEVFHVLCFNSRNILMADERVAEGGVTSCPVDPRRVFAAAIHHRSTALVLAHNHLSGDPTPSASDIQLTHQLRQGAELLCINLVDHVIIGSGSFASLRQRGDLA